VSADENGPTAPPLRLVRGDATPEEIAALVAVLQATAAAGAPPPRRRPVSEWAAPHRRLSTTFPSGPSGWRASAMPR
jgi:hypothetical protein